jgi:hypothetical protein
MALLGQLFMAASNDRPYGIYLNSAAEARGYP